jgi:hypothetical protein
VPGYTTTPVTDLGSSTAPFATLYNTSQILNHTAQEDDEFAFEIKNDAAGFASKSLDIVHTTGALAAGEEEDAILVNVDQSDSTGGEIIGYAFLATEGFAQCIGVEIGAGCDVIEQLSGSFVNPTEDIDNNGTPVAVGSLSGVNLWDNNPDYVIISDLAQFEEIEFLLSQVASGSGIAPTFEYQTTGPVWAAFNPTDGTNGMRNSGVVAWLPANVSGWVTDGGVYKIKITRTRVNLTTKPQAQNNGIKVAAITEYKWDASGNITCNAVTSDSVSIEASIPALTVKDTDNVSGATNGSVLFTDSADSAVGSMGVFNTDAFISNLQTNGNLNINLNGTGAILPQTTSDLGSSSLKFKNLYLSEIVRSVGIISRSKYI